VKRARPILQPDTPAAVALRLLTTVEVAQLLRVHPKHVYRLLRKGLPAQRVGGEWRYVADQVLAWAGARQTGAEAAGALSQPSETTLPGAGAGSGANAGVAPVNSLPPLLAANGDLVVERLLARLTDADGPAVGLLRADRARGIERLRRGEVLAAGYHGGDIPSSIEDDRLIFVHLVERQVGLVTRSKSAFSDLSQILKRKLASRPETAGVRALFDAELRKDGVDPKALHVQAALFSSHCEVVCAVARGEADVGLASHAWAASTGLHFRVLGSEPYGLVLRAAALADPRIARLCEVAQSSTFRRDVEGIPGYDARQTGAIRFLPARTP
jgi:putative molybdopterin biosynthesis protein